MEKQGAHDSHATASENGANHGFIGVRQSSLFLGLCGDRELRVRNQLKAKGTDGSLSPLKHHQLGRKS
jgi:hypothetical protein